MLFFYSYLYFEIRYAKCQLRVLRRIKHPRQLQSFRGVGGGTFSRILSPISVSSWRGWGAESTNDKNNAAE